MATLKELGDPIITYEDIVKEGEWISFPLGIFILSTPTRKINNRYVYRDVEAYDGLVILEEDKFEYRYTIAAGTLYYDAIIQILEGAGIRKYNIEKSDKSLITALEYPPGTAKREAISELLAAINFTPLFVDESGYFTSRLYSSPQERSVDVEYIEDEFSIIQDETTEELDLYGVPNAWVVTLNDPERIPPLTSVYENNNPDSPTSYQSRGNRRIVDSREVDEIADQEALDEYTARIAFEASQVFGKVSFSSALIPIHGYSDVVYLSKGDLNEKYSETNWSMDLKTDGVMTHAVRKVVSIG